MGQMDQMDQMDRDNIGWDYTGRAASQTPAHDGCRKSRHAAGMATQATGTTCSEDDRREGLSPALVQLGETVAVVLEISYAGPPRQGLSMTM